MLKRFKNLSFRVKLFVTTLGISFFSILLVSTAFIGYDQYIFQQTMVSDLQSVADIVSEHIGDTVSEGSSFEREAESALHSLDVNKYIISADILLSDNTVLVSYVNPSFDNDTPFFEEYSNQRTIESIIEYNEIVYGTLVIHTNLSPFIFERLRVQFITALAITLISMVIAFVLTSLILNIISNPVIKLAETARHVTETQDFTIRAPKFAEDELGELTDRFNDMLATIEGQHIDLVVVQNELEKRVRARTNHMLEEIRIRTEAESKAEAYNRELTVEVENHQKTEEQLERYFLEIQETNRSLEMAIEQANEMAVEAQAANSTKSDFLANMSHEIRTPMNAVMGFLGFLLDTKLDENQYDYAHSAQKASDHLMVIINDILDFSKIEAGKLELEKIKFNVRTAVEDVVDTLYVKAHEKNLNLACIIHPEVPTYLQGDPGRIRQILINLVGNAIKFTETGEVVIHVALDSRIEARNSVLLDFAVADTGIGLPEESTAELFDAFSQLDASVTRKHGGTGLGLTICKRLVMMMLGDIGVSSEVNRGSTFWFTAELVLMDDEKQEVEEFPIDMSDKRVLVVDDNVTNRELLHLHLETWQIAHQVVDTIRDAKIQLLEALEEGNAFTIMVLDVDMLEGENESFVLESREDSRMSGLGFILLTSIGNRNRTNTGDENVIYLNKPIRQANLLNSISAVMDEKGAETPRFDQSDISLDDSGDSLRLPLSYILLAEDNPMNQAIAKKMLVDMGCHLTIANNGQEAYDEYLAHNFDAVLMDVQMPVMGGIEATQKIREQEHFMGKRTPIIALTAHSMDGHREMCIDAGMDDYVSKPISRKALSAVLFKYLGSDGAKGEMLEESAIDLAEPLESVRSEVALESGNGSEDIVDLSRLREITGEDAEMIGQLIQIFLTDTDEHSKLLRVAIEESNVDGIVGEAHRIKGGAAQIGAEQLRFLVAEIEDRGRKNNLGDLELILVDFEKEYIKVHDHLETTIRS